MFMVKWATVAFQKCSIKYLGNEYVLTLLKYKGSGKAAKIHSFAHSPLKVRFKVILICEDHFKDVYVNLLARFV